MAEQEPAKTGQEPLSAPPVRRAALTFIFAAALMDVVALGIIIPVLPKLVESFVGGDTARAALYLGVFGTAWAMMQFVFSPIMGALSDRFGRRPVLLISIFGLGLDYVLMALAPNLAWLFIGRLISGITAASFSTAGAYIADITPPEKRAQSFGLISAAFGVGFVLGPALGGILGEIDPRLPFWAAAALALVNGLYGLFVLPESLPPDRRTPFRWSKANPVGAFQLLRSHPELLGLAAIAFLYLLGHQALQSTMVLYTGFRFGWSAAEVGAFLSCVGAASIVVQLFLVRIVVRRFGERGALIIGLSCGAVGMALYGWAPAAAMFYLALPVFCMIGLVQPGYQGLMSRRIDAYEQGRLQGAHSSIMGVTGMIGPSLYSHTFAWAIGPGRGEHVPGLAFYLAALLLGVGLVVAVRIAGRPARSLA